MRATSTAEITRRGMENGTEVENGETQLQSQKNKIGRSTLKLLLKKFGSALSKNIHRSAFSEKANGDSIWHGIIHSVLAF